MDLLEAGVENFSHIIPTSARRVAEWGSNASGNQLVAKRIQRWPGWTSNCQPTDWRLSVCWAAMSPQNIDWQ
jgi:hypothetical protein